VEWSWGRGEEGEGGMRGGNNGTEVLWGLGGVRKEGWIREGKGGVKVDVGGRESYEGTVGWGGEEG